LTSTHCRACWLERVTIPDRHWPPSPVAAALDQSSSTSELERAYAAGMVDGEGHIGLNPWKSSYLPLVVVTNTDPRLPDWFRQRFGGAVYWTARRNPAHKDRHNWRLQGRQAMTFLQEILPYLVLKRQQAALVSEYYEQGGDFHYGSRALPEDEKTRRADLHQRMKALNARGPRLSEGTAL